MTNNPNFASPHPPLPDVTSSRSTLDEAYKAHQIAKTDARTKASAADDAEIQLDRLYGSSPHTLRALRTQMKLIIASAGMQTKASRTTPSIVVAPEALSAAAGNHEGEIDLSWRIVDNAKSYIIQSNSDPPSSESWSHAETVTVANKTIQNLTSGKKYWFRVAAVGPEPKRLE